MRGVIAAGHRETAEAAAIGLRAGGNAFDAAVAGAAAACVVEPGLASLGGGGFMLARHDGGTQIYDFFCQTPMVRRAAEELDFRSIDADFGRTTQEFHVGLGAAATPGISPGLATIHKRLCTLPLSELIAPAIALARDGAVVTAFQSLVLRVLTPIYTAEAATRAVFCRDGQALVRAGDTLRQPDLAQTLEQLAGEGERPFIEGDIAQSLLRLCRERGGHLVQADLTRYQVEARRPLGFRYHGVDFDTNPPPSCGGLLVGFALRLAERLNLREGSFGAREHLRGLCQVMALTSKARVDSGLSQLRHDAADTLLDPAFQASYRAEVLGRPAAPRGTTHISVIDAAGNAAAVSLSNGEGCGTLVPRAGFMPNNVLGEEDINPRGFHHWVPNARVSSMMAPSIAAWPDGRFAVIGSGGSNRIRTAILQVVMHLIDFRMSLEAAIDAPRLHLEHGQLDVEPGYDPAFVAELEDGVASRRIWPDKGLFFGGVHAALSDAGTGALIGAGDVRRDGVTISV